MKRKESGLVFLDAGRKEPYTTDEVIAECSGVKRPTVTRLIRNRQNDLEEFGRLGFEIRTLQTKGGAQEVKIYHLNEQQSTLLITYLRNTEAVTAFKKALVREFYAMRKELQKRRELRIEGKPVRRSLTDMIRDNPDHNQYCYPDGALTGILLTACAVAFGFLPLSFLTYAFNRFLSDLWPFRKPYLKAV